MSTTSIRLKKSSIAGRIPSTSDLEFGEIAINYADGILYFKNSSNQVSSINARAIGVDSTATFSIIDSAYIQEKTSGAFDSDFSLKTTSDLAEGTRLYYTTARADSAFDVRLATKSTTNLSEGTNLYYTSARADSDAKNAISVTDTGGDGSLTYNSTTGVLTYTGPSASEVRAHITANKGVSITSGEINIDSANVKEMFSGSGDLSYNSNTGQFSIDVSAVYTADDFDSDYILAKDSANTAVERNKHTDTTKNFTVTVATKDDNHVYFGNGSGQGYVVDGTFSPVIHLQLGRTYRFNLSSSNMSSHPFRFYYNADKSGGQYTSGVTTASTYAEITVSESTPSVLHYQCSAHGYMGHALVVGTRNLTGLTTTNLTEGTNLYYTDTRFDTRLSSKSTSDLTEGTNQYYTEARVQSLVDSAYVRLRQSSTTIADSNDVINIVDSAYVQARQTNNPTGVDSAATIALIDSAYVQARQVDLQRDSNFIIDIIDSSYVQVRTRIGLDDIDFGSKKILYSNVYSQTSDLPNASTYHGMFAHVHATGKGYFAHGGNWIELANANQLFSGAYADLTGKPVLIDSDLTTSLIDSAYVQARQIKYTNADFTDSAFVTTQINNLIDAAPGALDTLNELAAAIGDDANFSTTITNSIAAKLDSAEATALIDSAYVQARQTNNPTGVDSAATIALIDSAYVQGRFNTLRESDNTLIVSGNIIPATDSSFSIGTAQKKFKDIHLSGGTVFIDNLALSADSATQTISIGQLDSTGAVNVIGVIATVDSAGVSAIVDSAFLEARLQSFVSEAELAAENFLDSTSAINLIDSAYVQARQTNNPTGVDSAATIALIDSAYVQVRQINNPTGVDSAATQVLIDSSISFQVDSAYVQARQINNPTGVDSAATIALIDSAYVQARQSSGGSGTTDSAAVINLIDSAYVQARQSSGGSGTTDSAAVINLIDSAYVQARQSLGNTGITVQDEGNSLQTAGTTLNFVGSAVRATGLSSEKTITVTSTLDSSAGVELINNTVDQIYINNKLGVDYGGYVVSATNAIQLLLAAVNIDYGSLTSPASLRSNYETI